MSSIYGQIVTDNTVEAQVLRSLQGWLPSYLPEVATQDHAGDVALPVSWQVVRDTPTKWNEQAMPAIVVQVGGTLSTQRRGSKYRAVYGCQVAAIIAGPTRERTREIAGVYSMAITLALCQHGDLDGLSDGVGWADTDYDLIDEARARTLLAAIVSFDIGVPNLFDVSAGPAGPTPEPDDPPVPGTPDYGLADEVDITVTATNGAP